MTDGVNEITADAFLADSVVVADGKLYVQGAGWDMVFAGSFPVRHSRIGIGVLLRVPWTATNQMHNFSVKIVDPDEKQIILGNAPLGSGIPDGKVREINGQFNIGRPPLLTAGDSQMVPIAMNLDGIEFAEPNAYSVVLAVDGKELRRIPLRVKAVVQMPTAGPGPSQLPRLG